MSIESWLARISEPEWIVHAKYLSANDTYAKDTVHQGGPYLSKELLRLAFPVLCARAMTEANPDLMLQVDTKSHSIAREIRLVYYNSKRLERRTNGRDEARLTQWGGRDHPLVNPESTGSILVLAFRRSSGGGDARECEAWVTRSAEEEDAVIAVLGPVEPGAGVIGGSLDARRSVVLVGEHPCSISTSEMRDEWKSVFPSGEELLRLALQRLPPTASLELDSLLIKRRDCEYRLFLSVEKFFVEPALRQGFSDVDSFIAFAHGVINRRKSRAGKSLELHVRQILEERTVSHSWGESTEGNRTPDFLFPSIEHYRKRRWPSSKLRMLAIKTTCKDRWRQILNEASRIRTKHLLTLQEGVSVAQFDEMREENVRLVVPKPLHHFYPPAVRAHLLSITQFVSELKTLDA